MEAGLAYDRMLSFRLYVANTNISKLKNHSGPFWLGIPCKSECFFLVRIQDQFCPERNLQLARYFNIFSLGVYRGIPECDRVVCWQLLSIKK